MLDATGTLTTIDVNSGAGNSFAGKVGGFTAFEGALYFSAETAATCSELFRLDGTTGVVTAIDLQAGAGSSFAGEDGGFFRYDGALYFNAFDDTVGSDALFRLNDDGTSATVVTLTTIRSS